MVSVVSPPLIGKGPRESLLVLIAAGIFAALGVIAYFVAKRTIWRDQPEEIIFNTFAGFVFALPISSFFLGVVLYLWLSAHV